jgi:hypothetical protein
MKVDSVTDEEQLLEELMELAHQVGKDIILSKGEDLMPMWIIVAADGAYDIVGTPWKDEAEKVITVLAIKAKLREENALAYSLLSEVWQADAPPGFKPTDPRPWRTVEEAPNRHEAMMVIAATPKLHKMRSWEMHRDESGKVCALGEQKDIESAGGRMTQLFK